MGSSIRAGCSLSSVSSLLCLFCFNTRTDCYKQTHLWMFSLLAACLQLNLRTALGCLCTFRVLFRRQDDLIDRRVSNLTSEFGSNQKQSEMKRFKQRQLKQSFHGLSIAHKLIPGMEPCGTPYQNRALRCSVSANQLWPSTTFSNSTNVKVLGSVAVLRQTSPTTLKISHVILNCIVFLGGINDKIQPKTKTNKVVMRTRVNEKRRWKRFTSL